MGAYRHILLGMNVSVPIPDEFARRFSADEDVGRLLLEALALEEFRRERLNRADLRRLLGFQTRGELDVFLSAHGVVGRYSASDLERDRADLRRIGL